MERSLIKIIKNLNLELTGVGKDSSTQPLARNDNDKNMKIKIDPEKRIGWGIRGHRAGKFKMNDETNKAEVIKPITDSEETIKMGAESCPTAAIIIE